MPPQNLSVVTQGEDVRLLHENLQKSGFEVRAEVTEELIVFTNYVARWAMRGRAWHR